MPASDGPLAGVAVAVRGGGPAAAHARHLLADLGVSGPAAGPGVVEVAVGGGPAAGDWAASGAMALTGRADGPPLGGPGAPAAAVRGALSVLGALRPAAPLPGVGLLGERAAVAGLARRGPWSAGGAFRTLPCGSGVLGLSLPRPGDPELLPALLGGPVAGEPWQAVADWAAALSAADAAERAQLLGLAAAEVPSPAGGPWLRATAGGPRRHRRAAPLVLNLSALWAGPLCAHLLGLTGCRVVTVESIGRPDGARYGPAAFHDLLHAGDESVALDLASPDGVTALRRLVAAADLVVEASRPRALAQLGIDAAEVVAAGTSWLSITGYGRTGPWSNRVGFGDDVAAAAGLVVADGPDLLPCGDALADPLAGVHAAAAAAAALQSPTAFLLDVSMVAVAAAAAALPGGGPVPVRRTGAGWEARTEAGWAPVAPPRGRQAAGAAPPLGAHTDAVLAELAC